MPLPASPPVSPLCPAAGGWGPSTCQAVQGSGGLVSGHCRTGVSLTPWVFWARPEMFWRSEYKGGRLHWMRCQHYGHLGMLLPSAQMQSCR